MKDIHAEIRKTDPKRLVQIIKLREQSDRLWNPDELSDILKHQLSAPVDVNLSRLGRGVARRAMTACAAEGLLLKSFRDLFFHPHPPIEMLIVTKEFAKASSHHPDSPIPHEISTVLYLAAIVAALLRCGKYITDLDEAALTESLQWVLSQTWLDSDMRQLFQEGTQAIEKRKSRGQ